ncbi:hypothetical protein [Virgibacillus ihumii]|uniref:hypothetical protein n=1 Tax=Virgibacillus ihumii TaxID=2686091 RepID=UPI00157BC81A|nr:hypothetical protein [Virgibacillus ihumii]
MYKKLVVEMKKSGLTMEDLADCLKITPNEVYERIYQIGTIFDEHEGEMRNDFYFSEALIITRTFFPGRSPFEVFGVLEDEK